jgi:hypothetical protein
MTKLCVKLAEGEMNGWTQKFKRREINGRGTWDDGRKKRANDIPIHIFLAKHMGIGFKFRIPAGFPLMDGHCNPP